MKKVLFFAIFAIILSGCTKTERRLVPTAEEAYYVIQTSDEKKLWGLEISGDMAIECKYDSIARDGGPAYYKALKNGLWYAFSFQGKRLEKVPPFTDFEDISLIGSGIKNPGWIIRTPEGVYGCYMEHLDYFCFGPYEDFFPGARGFFFKGIGTGHWGYQDYNYKLKKAIPLLPSQYESIIEVSGGKPQNGYFLVKKDNKWSFFDKRRKPPYVEGTDLFFDGNFQPINISIEKILNWYKSFPSNKKTEKISYKDVECTKNIDGTVGIIKDL